MAKPPKLSASAQARLADAHARLAALHAAALFTELAASEIDPRVPRLSSHHTRDALVRAVYLHLAEHPVAYALRELTDIPTGLGLERVLTRAARRHVQLTAGADAGLFEPTSRSEWARLVDLALRAIGDGRHVVPIELLDEDDALFVVATAEQARVLAETRLANPRFMAEFRDRPLPRVDVDAVLRTAVAELAARLPGARASVRAGAIELELSPADAAELGDALYAERYRATIRAARAARPRP